MSTGLVHVGDELREVNGNLITHKRPDEISQILVCVLQSADWYWIRHVYLLMLF